MNRRVSMKGTVTTKVIESDQECVWLLQHRIFQLLPKLNSNFKISTEMCSGLILITGSSFGTKFRLLIKKFWWKILAVSVLLRCHVTFKIFVLLKGFSKYRVEIHNKDIYINNQIGCLPEVDLELYAENTDKISIPHWHFLS